MKKLPEDLWNRKAIRLFLYTAVFELPIGLLFLAFPSWTAGLFFGFTMSELTSVTVARIAGAAITFLAFLSWQSRGVASGREGLKLARSLLLYNVLVAIILVWYLALAKPTALIILALIVHLLLGTLCVAVLTTKRGAEG
jgi:hypothetical protein